MYKNTTMMDKLEIAETRLQDTICGYFSGHHAVTTIDNARAVGTLIRDIRNYLVTNNYMPKLSLLSDPSQKHPLIKATSRRSIHLSNFAKHARKDGGTKEGYSHSDATLALQHACINFSIW